MKNKLVPPSEYEELIRVIHEQYDTMSKTYQRIAVYLTQNPNDVAVQSVNTMGSRCEVHASSFVRFAQSLGYKGFKELQAVFRQRLTTAAPGFEARVKALDQDLGKQGKHAILRDLVVRDIASLQDMISSISEESLSQAAQLLGKADTIYLVGQLRSAPVVELLRYVLTMLGQKTVLLDTSGGLATHMSRIIGADDLLLAVSFRFYATEVVNIVEEVAEREIPIIAISDSSLSPLAKSASILFSVPEHEYTFSRSLAAPMCLAQALTLTLASQLQEGVVDPRIPTVTQE
jgi:DNA-binding MurR/RpiR family transcriptional regulator